MRSWEPLFQVTEGTKEEPVEEADVAGSSMETLIFVFFSFLLSPFFVH